MNTTIKGYMTLMRPATMPTALADVLAGFTIAGILEKYTYSELLTSEILLSILGLMFSTVCLYAGGMVLGDVFDYESDLKKRPERPIPSGAVSVENATILGSGLLISGLFTAFLVDQLCGYVALTLVVAILIYDALLKRHEFFGPVNLGICRGLNLLMGISIVGYIHHWWITLIPVAYIVAVHLLSMGETKRNSKRNIVITSAVYAFVVLSIAKLSWYISLNIVQTLPFLALFSILIFRPLVKAHKENTTSNIKNAVKAGVWSFIVLDACIAVGFSEWWFGILILLLLPLSKYLSKRFAVAS